MVSPALLITFDMDWDTLFGMYFTTVAGFQFHPRASLEGAKVLTLEESAAVAYKMCLIHKSYKEDICLLWQQQ